MVSLRASYLIYLSRNNVIWRPWVNNRHPINAKSVHSTPYVQDHGLGGEQYDFVGFTKQEINRSRIINEKRIDFITQLSENEHVFGGFFDLEICKAKTINSRKIDIIRKKQKPNSPRSFSEDETCTRLIVGRKKTDMSELRGDLLSRPLNSIKITGLINLGNTCYMNSVMQCLNCLAPLVDYFIGEAYLKDIHPESKYDGKLAGEVSAALKNMNDKASPITLACLKNLIGNLYSPFEGYGQKDAHEFLIKLIELLCEDLGRGTTATLHYPPDSSLIREDNKEVPKIIEILQGMQTYTISCKNCPYISSTLETFNVLSLSPTSANENIEKLLKSAYGDTHIDYTCPNCDKQNSATQKKEIKKLPPILIIHLNRFSIGSGDITKNKQYVEFPVWLNMENCEFSYELKGITNHYGTLTSGHYTSFCKSRRDGDWYKCDDSRVTKMITSIKTSAAYLLYYELCKNAES